MRELKNQFKVFSALSIASSDTREDTLISVILRTLYDIEKVKKEDLSKHIEKLFGFEPYSSELSSIIIKLSEANKLSLYDEYLSLSNDERERIAKLDVILKDQDKERFQNFKNFITDTLHENLSSHEIEFLWSYFQEYLINSFYEFGEKALNIFNPQLIGKRIENNEDILLIILTKIKDKKLCEIFRNIVEQFPDFASKNDINFINDLAQKTLSFSSLGINPDLADSSIDQNLIDWILYIDTNVLYSLLDLHFHPENDACKALIKLIRDNNQYVKIKLRYSELTYKELSIKRADFKLLDDKLTDSSIKALLRSNDLDEFSRIFYQNLISNRDSTLHPSQIIDLAQSTLRKNTIEIGRNKARIDKIGEDYLNLRIQDYLNYISKKNEIKEEFCKNHQIPFHPHFRSDRQAKHDITLREILIDSRGSLKPGEELSLNSAKFFAITLDDLLISYDQSQIKEHYDKNSFPVFFKPSFLLSRLVRILPLKTQDYKTAFVKALTTRGFNKDINKSHDILKIVNYLKSKGIDNEQIIFNLITEELFLDKFRKNSTNPEFNTGEFIESELNREFEIKEVELLKVNESLTLKTKETIDLTEKTQNLETKKLTLEEELNYYKIALRKLKKDVDFLKGNRILSPTQYELNFETAENKKQINDLQSKLKKQLEKAVSEFKQKEFKKWQKKIWWNLIWVIPVTLILFIIIMLPNTFSLGNENSIKYLMAFLMILIDGIFMYLIKMRYWDERNKEAKRKAIKSPEEIQSQLDNLFANDTN